MTIIISPFAKLMRNGKQNPKNYPYWKELILELEKNYKVIQIGTTGEEIIAKEQWFNVPLPELVLRLKTQMDTFISVDTFLPHLCNAYNLPSGVVIFSKSDPKIFGYEHNINILKDRTYLRPDQFANWEACEFEERTFPSAQNILNYLRQKHLFL